MDSNRVGPRVRFAPSPTGSLHLGNARTALFNWLVARREGGTLILRVEDTDLDRHQQGAEEAIFEDLRWLGLDWDEGPDCGGPLGPYRQSERGEHYRAAARQLMEIERAYRCFCDGDGSSEDRRGAGYPGTCRDLPRAEAEQRAEAGEPHALRFAMVDPENPRDEVIFNDGLRGSIAVPLAELADTVIVRRDGRPTYNFAVVVDDAAMEIDVVIRGDDHLSNTPRQVLMFDALKKQRPRFVHLPMVRGADGSRLSKRHGAVSVGAYREQGYPAAGVVNALALLGWGPQDNQSILSVEELCQRFGIDRVGRSPAAFDLEKFEWVCAQQIARMDDEQLGVELERQLESAGLIPEGPLDPGWRSMAIALVRPGLARFGEIPGRLRILFGDPEPSETESLLDDDGRRVAVLLAAALEATPPIDGPGWKEIVGTVKRQSGQKGKGLFQPMRLALTGCQQGPDLDRLVPAIVVGHRLWPGRIPSAAQRIRRNVGLSCDD